MASFEEWVQRQRRYQQGNTTGGNGQQNSEATAGGHRPEFVNSGSFYGSYNQAWADASTQEDVADRVRSETKRAYDFANNVANGGVEMRHGRRVVENRAQPLDEAAVLAARKAYRAKYPEIDWTNGELNLEKVRQVTRIVTRDELADGEYLGRWYGSEVRVTIGEAQYSIQVEGHGTGQEVVVRVTGHQVASVRRMDAKGTVMR